MAARKRTSKLRDVVSAESVADDTSAIDEAVTPPEDEQMLDPATSERRYWRDPLSGVKREIWRPGTFLSRRSV